MAKFNRCLSDISGYNRDTAHYNPRWKTLQNSTEIKSPRHLNRLCREPWRYKDSVLGMGEDLFSYGSGGYIAKLGYEADIALKVSKNMKQNLWIDDRSAIVSVEFVVFEPSSLLLSNVMLVYEKLTTGGKRKNIDVTSQYIFPSTGSSYRTFYLICILLWSIVVLFLAFLEFKEISKGGRKYFKSFFNWVSFLLLVSSLCSVIVIHLKENGLRDFLRRIRHDPFGSWSAFEVVKWTQVEDIAFSIPVVLTTVKSLKLVQFSHHVHVMKWTLKAASRYICSFSVILFILFTAFAQLGKLLFGSSEEEYATLYKSLSTVIQLAIGIGKLRSGNLAHVFLMTCMLSITVIFTDAFIAMLNKEFHEARNREHQGKELGAVIKQCLHEWIERKASRKKSFQSSIRENYSTAQFLRHQFKRTKLNTTDKPGSGIICLQSVRHGQLESNVRYGEQGLSSDNDGCIRIHRNCEDFTTPQVKLAKHNMQSVNDDTLGHDTKGFQGDYLNCRGSVMEVSDILIPCGKSTYGNLQYSEDSKLSISNATPVDSSKANDIRYCELFHPAKEDTLLCEVKDAMENAHSELGKYLRELESQKDNHDDRLNHFLYTYDSSSE